MRVDICAVRQVIKAAAARQLGSLAVADIDDLTDVERRHGGFKMTERSGQRSLGDPPEFARGVRANSGGSPRLRWPDRSVILKPPWRLSTSVKSSISATAKDPS